MADDGWRNRLEQAAWGHPVGRLATFVFVAVAGAATVHRGGYGFDLTTPLLCSLGPWAVSLVRWPPQGRGN